MIQSKSGRDSIDFDNPQAVRALNRALLKNHHSISFFDLPESFLCPPIPGRLDYLLHASELLNEKKNVKLFDLGVEASGIYPLLAYAHFGWSSVGSDINLMALKAAQAIVAGNKLEEKIELRHQMQPKSFLEGVFKKSESFDLLVCNPPFHDSPESMLKGVERKRRNLGLSGKSKLNFGGVSEELWCEGGERAFIQGLIFESAQFRNQVKWFTCLVSKEENLKLLLHYLKTFKPSQCEVIEMQLGNKKSRLLAWSYQ